MIRSNSDITYSVVVFAQRKVNSNTYCNKCKKLPYISYIFNFDEFIGVLNYQCACEVTDDANLWYIVGHRLHRESKKTPPSIISCSLVKY